MKMQVRSLVSLRGLRIQKCLELWCRLQTAHILCGCGCAVQLQFEPQPGNLHMLQGPALKSQKKKPTTNKRLITELVMTASIMKLMFFSCYYKVTYVLFLLIH